MPAAARITDMHVCPMVTALVPHVGGPIIPLCSPNVITGFMNQARVTDFCICVGPIDVIVKGSPTVLVNNLPAARIGDMTVHGGVIVTGFATVLIGETAAGGGGPPAASPGLGLAQLHQVANAVNPGSGTINCGNIIDAVVDRLRNPNSQAVAPTDQDGSFTDIEQRFGTTLDWNSSFSDAFEAVEAGGPGTIAVVGILYPPPSRSSHVVILANEQGGVGIVEGQGDAHVIPSAEAASATYGAGSTVGYGIIPPPSP